MMLPLSKWKMKTHFASTQRPKIGASLGDHIVIQLDHHLAHFIPIDRYFEKDITVFFQYMLLFTPRESIKFDTGYQC